MMNQQLLEKLKSTLSGDVLTDEETLKTHSMDKSIFAIRPEVVVSPKNTEDVKQLVTFVSNHKKQFPSLSLTARAAGTCMSGGGLNDSIIVSFMKYFNHEPSLHGHSATVEPGLYYRDFETYTKKHNLLFPSYPASKMLCAMGGIIGNNAGGEKSLSYGKTEDYVESMRVVLADGNEYTIKPLSESELHHKLKLQNFEGKLYRKIHRLITAHYDLIMKSKPAVSKNSAGYSLWNVFDSEKKVFDLTKLFTGSQATLGLMTSAQLRLVPIKKHAEMLIVYVNDLSKLAEIVNVILPHKPESLETYDDITLNLAMKYHAELGQKMGNNSALGSLAMFGSEYRMKWFGGLPKLTIQAEFTADTYEEISETIKKLEEKLKPYDLKIKWAKNEEAEEKFWHIRRDSFALLSSKIKDRYACPFIDDWVVRPEYLPEFLPKFMEIMKKYPTIQEAFTGHIGNGNFHIFPLVKLTDPQEQKYVFEISEQVFKLVTDFKGSIDGEHNDGWVRTPYLPLQFNKKVLTLFSETKKIFDPLGIFNPHKKTDPDLNFAMKHLRQEW